MDHTAERVSLKLERAADDPAVRSAEFQAELQTFIASMRQAGVDYNQRAMAFDSADAVGYPLAEFVIKNWGTIAAPLAGLCGAWVQAKYGRKVRLKVGEVEAEAGSVKDIERLFDIAAAHKKPDDAAPE